MSEGHDHQQPFGRLERIELELLDLIVSGARSSRIQSSLKLDQIEIDRLITRIKIKFKSTDFNDIIKNYLIIRNHVYKKLSIEYYDHDYDKLYPKNFLSKSNINISINFDKISTIFLILVITFALSSIFIAFLFDKVQS